MLSLNAIFPIIELERNNASQITRYLLTDGIDKEQSSLFLCRVKNRQKANGRSQGETFVHGIRAKFRRAWNSELEFILHRPFFSKELEQR